MSSLILLVALSFGHGPLPRTLEAEWTVPAAPASSVGIWVNPYYGPDHNVSDPLRPRPLPVAQPRFAHPVVEELRALPGFPWAD